MNLFSKIFKHKTIGTVLDYDGNSYKTIIIGDQEWMSENLNVSHFRNGDPIKEVTLKNWGDSIGPAFCYYNDNVENGKKYGKLYNWLAVYDPRGLAPEGWHVPCDVSFDPDKHYGSNITAMNPDTLYFEMEWLYIIEEFGGAKAGRKMKSKRGWKWFGNGNNKSGFAGRPCGCRDREHNFSKYKDIELGTAGRWWTSRSCSAYSANLRSASRAMYKDSYGVFWTPKDQVSGLSVRCMKDRDLTKLFKEEKYLRPEDEDHRNKQYTDEISKLNNSIFKSIKIGKQIWMAENLKVNCFRNGDPIPEAKTHQEWQRAGEEARAAWCYYENNPENNNEFGKLYNWYTLIDPRGIAPFGWHVPNDDEWQRLFEFFGRQGTAGNDMIDKSGFNAILTGGRYDKGYFDTIHENCYWWMDQDNPSSKYAKVIWLNKINIFDVH